MARISTYPGPSSPSLSDMLIGTDVNDMNATKNFTIGDIVSVPGSSTYVPYTGATADVDLNTFNITANSFIIPGGLSTEFLKADGSVDSNTYLTASAAASTYVPYTGATGDVNLGTHKLTSQSLEVTTDDVTMQGIQAFSGNFFAIGDNGWLMSGFLVDFVNNRYYLGDYNSNVNGTYIKVDDANSRIELSKGIYTSGSEGTLGDVLVSQGAGVPAQWTSVSSPSYGSFYDLTTQTTAGSAEEYMEFGTTDISSGVTIVNNGLGNPTQITVAQTGVYNIQFSAQLTKNGGTAADVNIYLKKNGLNVSASNTLVTLANNNHYVVAAWNFFIQLNAGQYAEIVWYTTNANVTLQAFPVAVPPLESVPSVILTVNKVS